MAPRPTSETERQGNPDTCSADPSCTDCAILEAGLPRPSKDASKLQRALKRPGGCVAGRLLPYGP
eukprot:365216-Chlamydomonas_euryale.AAC.2